MDIPDDIILEISEYLDIVSLAMFLGTCTRL